MMKAKYFLLAILCISVSTSAEAQILKKLKKKAEQAAERTILKKTDEIVTEKTEQTIDGVANGNEKKPDSTTTTSNTQKNTATPANNAAMNPKNHEATQILDQYEFNWELKTVMTSGKDQTAEFNYLINSNTTDYSGLEMSSEELKGQGTMYMVMDNLQKTNIMFMDMNGQKMAQVHKMPELKEGKNKSNVSFKEIGTKEILGFTCYGIEVEDQQYKGQLYFTLDAPVNFSAFFAMANNKSAPKGFDPALLQVLKEDALLMEMTMQHKQKSKENYAMRAISLEQKKKELSKKDYQLMKMGF
ncbi:DUF4412 domain-containing protein [Geojedonia litorea]|uniref:DUF4412 domain-containing protein n=1 Tax=Geojedonia litorea TaxID=1268269 RepID=A0ABV9MZA2_9FLAO